MNVPQVVKFNLNMNQVNKMMTLSETGEILNLCPMESTKVTKRKDLSSPSA